MALFSKRLTCFYCGRRSNQPVQSLNSTVRKFHCENCEADNYLDQNGDITDPPTAATNPQAYGSDAQSPRFESIGFEESDLFCSRCIRNQHLFTHSLAAYQAPSDDPSFDHENHYAQYRRSMEDRYPTVCDNCEPRVRQRIKQAGYEAKADHLRRMMDQTRASKTARQARNRSWQSLLVYAGAIGYWGSVCGQLAWDVLGALTAPSSPTAETDVSMDPSVHLMTCVGQTLDGGRIPVECAYDLAPAAGLALVAGSLSLWWNPRLRMKIEGRSGRFKGLAEYYQVQLIVMVVRCVFWSLLKDPFASGIEATLPAALHMFMILFTLLSVVISRRVIHYDTRPLVNWSDNSWESAPLRSTETSPVPESRPRPIHSTPNATTSQIRQRFPFDKLGSARPIVESPQVMSPTPPPESEDMDWTPSAPQNIQPTVSVYQRNRPSAFDGPSPFHGNLPAAPQPPAWTLRNKTPVKPIEQVIEPNPFHRNLSPTQNQWQKKPTSPEPVFQPPKFFPASDHDAATGLETLFNRAFDLGAEEAPRGQWNQPKPRPISYAVNTPRQLVLQYLRLFLLLGSMTVWTYSQNHQTSIPGNYIETCALGSASLISGFALLEAVKRPLAQWNGMEILVYITELGAAVHLGAHLPQEAFEREYFDRYGKILLGFMAVQEILNLLAFYRSASATPRHEDRQNAPTSPRQELSPQGAIGWSPAGSPVNSPTMSQSFSPQLQQQSFASRAQQFSPQPQQFSPQQSAPPSVFLIRSWRFTMDSLKANEPVSDYEQDSDSETVATEFTARTDATNRNIRYGRNPIHEHNPPFSPRRSELGPGLGGLSLEDRPTPRRITRSQTQQPMTPGRRFPSRVVF
ncbi:hypothetical protein N7509_002269 [Penicillium cosmopolitanum]|uniref:Ima1 N-terminal domain-containing protein n=1 Tax=Penicillium cosmopolitanum TaxID=1131564 RepID=A0A9W9W8L6_9EURO|nr:uncharacterized protein N7509_002269 [Penicillium cosmopolitanum]KAJ5408386.1 hypothetical protein N7509_002269 [Penicillium cosmopolitanum]